MKKNFHLIGTLIGLAASAYSCRVFATMPNSDPYLWLEDIESPRALNWVNAHNAPTLQLLQGDPRYASVYNEIEKILLAKDRLQVPAQRGGFLYHFLQDETHVRGLLRRTTLAEYRKKDPQWEPVLDIDALAKAENENWVYHGSDCLEPQAKRCLISLSRGGGDAAVVREFDSDTKLFVQDGFQLPEAKSFVSWLDENTLLVGTDFGPDSLTLSGYPRVIKIWKRGTPLSQAELLFEGQKQDVFSYASTFPRPEGTVTVVTRALSFFEAEHFILSSGKNLKQVPLPTGADFKGVFQGHFLAVLRSDWDSPGTRFEAGTLVALPLNAMDSPDPVAHLKKVFSPTDRQTLYQISSTKNFLLLNVLDTVKSEVYEIRFKGSQIESKPVPLPTTGAVSLVSTSSYEDDFFATYESFLTPPTLHFLSTTAAGIGLETLKQLPDRFDATPFVAEQAEAVSADGTRVPYFLIRSKNVPWDGSTPTLLYGYGGFEVSLTPNYLATAGKAWLEKGGAYAIANIRGGGEFGPRWHSAAILKNRQRAYDDFIAVSESLISRKLTSPAKLGIQGGSNGGLLMGVMLTQRPDLFNAIVCQVPLLDMLRYHHLLAGNSWMGEYGNPDDPQMRAVIEKYSPYQNIQTNKKYPKVFFMTSTKDDRVHPGHARKMAAKMESCHQALLYYENTEGGHGAAANLNQRIRAQALTYTYLYQQLMP